MLKKLHTFRRWAGVDRAVFFSNAAQMLRLVTGPITMALREELTALQYGRKPDPHGWLTRLG